MRGRGASDNPRNRFERIEYVPEPGEEAPAPPTDYLRDDAKSLIVRNDSPDIPFEAGINPYRGCEHGCIYCYARPSHEYLGLSAGLDFESKILVKERAPEILRDELTDPGWTPTTLALSGNTDPYQPIERHLKLTRRCLGVLAEFRNPVAIVTKNDLVTRDLDLLVELARHEAVSVAISITSLDHKLSRILEPRTSPPDRRLEAIRVLAEAGVPVGTLVAPVIPGLTDHETPSILNAVAGAGGVFAGSIMLRLPHAVAPLFEAWLAEHFPDRRKKVLNRVRGMRGGRLNDARFGRRMRGDGFFADQTEALFHAAARKAGLDGPGPELSTRGFQRPQRELF